MSLNLENSDRLFKEACELSPGGVLGIRKPNNFVPGEYPIFIKKAKGMRLIDVDGNEYIDCLASYGPIIIGHREDEIDNAVINKIKSDGFCFNLAQPHQNELLKLLIKNIPCAEMGFMVKTGSDAATSAIRIARAYTGKNMVLRCGYHGWHDWAIAVKNGIPENCYKDVDSFGYNNIESVKAKFKEYKNQIAAVIITPLSHELNAPIEEPEDDFLNKIKNLVHEEKAVLIFDEIRTGFRMRLGGAQEYYNVIPDMAIIGKAMANGYPISAVVGKREIMNSMEEKHVFISSTFFPNSLEMVAAIETIKFLKKNNVIQDIWDKGKWLKQKIKNAISETKVDAFYSGIEPMPFITFPKDKNNPENKKYRERRNKFYTELIRRGIFMQPFHHGYLAYRHTQKDMEKIANAIYESLDVVKKEVG